MTYSAEEGREYRKVATVMARQATGPGIIPTLEGDHTYESGDYICGPGVAGEFWPVKRTIFEATYVPAGEARADLAARIEETRDALEGMVRQFGYWSSSAGGIHTGGLSALEGAFDVLGWADPHPLPERCCDEPGCTKEGTMGWPTRPGGTGLNGGYRTTCWDHSDIARERREEGRA